MANLATVLKDEIARLARKEIRKEHEIFKKSSAQHRRDIASLKRKVVGLERRIAMLEGKVLSKLKPARIDDDSTPLRFTSKGLKSQRNRLGLSANDYGDLIGVSGLTIYNWEKGSTRPRKVQLARLASIRKMGKKEAKTRLRLLKKSKK